MVGREQTHLVAEKQADEDLVGSSGKEYKAALQDDDLMKIDAEAVVGVLENTAAVGQLDMVGMVVLQKEDVAVGLEEPGIVGLVHLELEEVDSVEEQVEEQQGQKEEEVTV